MSQRMNRSFQGLILTGLFIFFVYKAINGQLTWYINARFIPLTLIGMAFLAILAQTLFSEVRRSRRQEQEEAEHHHEEEHDHDYEPAATNLWFMIVPLLIGVFIPAKPLDSSAFSTRGFSTSAPLVSSNSSTQVLDTQSDQRNILDWLKAFNYEEDITQFVGQPAAVIGFVYFDKSLEADQFYVSRFVIACCAADGFAIAMPVKWSDSQTLQKDAWVLVKGSIQSTTIDGNRVPMIVADSVQSVPVPDQPYIFP